MTSAWWEPCASSPDGWRSGLTAAWSPSQISAPSDLPPLPAAVEVAAYRIITEAMTNAARHSGARRVDVQLALVDRDLVIEIRDDGASGDGASGDGTAPTAWSPGVGLISMRDRAAELGGSCQAGPGPGGGRVTASLPLANRPPVSEAAVSEAALVSGMAVTRAAMVAGRALAGTGVTGAVVTGASVTGASVTGAAGAGAELSVP